MTTPTTTAISPDEHVVRTRVLSSLGRSSASIPTRFNDFECAVIVMIGGTTQVPMASAFQLPSFAPRVEHIEQFVHTHLAEMLNIVIVGGLAESVSGAQGAQDDAWAAQVYGLVEAGQHEDAMDLVYEHVDPKLTENHAQVDLLLKRLDPNRLSAEVIVSVLIVTLAARDLLPSRADFVARSRPVLGRESEGANEVLRGLE